MSFIVRLLKCVVCSVKQLPIFIQGKSFENAKKAGQKIKNTFSCYLLCRTPLIKFKYTMQKIQILLNNKIIYFTT